MITFTCDVCKKKLDNPDVDRLFYYANHSICEPCKDNFELNVKSQIRAKEPYTTDWYEQFIGDSLDKAVQKGKI
ncbi:MAG: hypothetical protein FWB83_05105 [Treponema sp.]|nr:hypothetical protein [Treponema sp.]